MFWTTETALMLVHGNAQGKSFIESPPPKADAAAPVQSSQ